MKAIQLLINSKLPEELRDPNLKLDARSLNDLLAEVARSHPEQYEEISKLISDVGRKASYDQGETLTLNDMMPVLDRDRVIKQMDAEIKQLKKEDPENFARERINIWNKYSKILQDTTMQEALAQGNNLAYSVASGARGKPAQLQAMLTTPGVYADFQGRPVPLFVRSSFAEGLRPAEYLAGTFGARSSVISTKVATAKGGDLGKQMVQAAAPVTITKGDCGTSNGIDLSVDDDSLKGRVLQNEAAGFGPGTVIDKQVLSRLRKKGVDEIVARSPMTCSAKDGVCAKCAGVDARGKFRNIGESVGIEAAQAISEPVTQMALNSKHTAGQSGGKKEYSGFDVINRIAQSPEVFPDRAIVAEKDGRVERIEEAPQGGKYVVVNGEEHYVQPGYEILVKPGDQLEAGDQLSDGVVDSGDIVRLRGLGEGRRFYSERLKKALDDSGVWADKRNTEMLARAALNHVQIDDNEGMGDFLPDDVVSYNALESSYVPSENARALDPSEAVGKFLEQPVLHYSIGTRITPRIAERIKKHNKNKIFTSDQSPGFSPKMVRLRAAMHNNPDWLASMHTSYLKAQLNEAGMRGRDTNVESNTHFGPRLAIGKGFGDKVEETGAF